jgi:HEPN domain-containing protein
VGVDPPKRHDVGGAVLQHAARFPAEWQARLAEIEEISRELTDEPGLAFYGDEQGERPPGELFTAEDAAQACRWADDLLVLFEQFLETGKHAQAESGQGAGPPEDVAKEPGPPLETP